MCNVHDVDCVDGVLCAYSVIVLVVFVMCMAVILLAVLCVWC